MYRLVTLRVPLAKPGLFSPAKCHIFMVDFLRAHRIQRCIGYPENPGLLLSAINSRLGFAKIGGGGEIGEKKNHYQPQAIHYQPQAIHHQPQ